MSCITVNFIVYVFFAGSSLDTCTGLQHLAMNTNPELLTDCTRDEACSMLTCQAAGIIASQLDTLALILKQCESPPGVTVQITAKDGKAIVDQLVTKPTNISQTLASIARADAHVFVNSTDKTIGIAVSCTLNNTNEPLFLLHAWMLYYRLYFSDSEKIPVLN